MRQQNQKLANDYDVLTKEHAQLKTRYGELDETFAELNAEWVGLNAKCGQQEWLFNNQLRLKQEELEEQRKMSDEMVEKIQRENSQLRERVSQLEATATSSSPLPEPLVSFLGYLVSELKSCPPNRVSPLRKSIDERLMELLKTIDPDVEFPEDVRKNGSSSYHFESIQKAIAKLQQSHSLL